MQGLAVTGMWIDLRSAPMRFGDIPFIVEPYSTSCAGPAVSKSTIKASTPMTTNASDVVEEEHR